MTPLHPLLQFPNRRGSTAVDPSRSFRFAFGTALPAPFRSFAGATGIGAGGWSRASCATACRLTLAARNRRGKQL